MAKSPDSHDPIVFSAENDSAFNFLNFFSPIPIQCSIDGVPKKYDTIADLLTVMNKRIYTIKGDQNIDLKLKIELLDDLLSMAVTQNPQIVKSLLATDDSLLQDNAWDDLWAIGKKGQGQNENGKAWMRLRQRLKDELANNKTIKVQTQFSENIVKQFQITATQSSHKQEVITDEELQKIEPIKTIEEFESAKKLADSLKSLSKNADSLRTQDTSPNHERPGTIHFRSKVGSKKPLETIAERTHVSKLMPFKKDKPGIIVPITRDTFNKIRNVETSKNYKKNEKAKDKKTGEESITLMKVTTSRSSDEETINQIKTDAQIAYDQTMRSHQNVVNETDKKHKEEERKYREAEIRYNQELKEWQEKKEKHDKSKKMSESTVDLRGSSARQLQSKLNKLDAAHTYLSRRMTGVKVNEKPYIKVDEFGPDDKNASEKKHHLEVTKQFLYPDKSQDFLDTITIGKVNEDLEKEIKRVNEAMSLIDKNKKGEAQTPPLFSEQPPKKPNQIDLLNAKINYQYYQSMQKQYSITTKYNELAKIKEPENLVPFTQVANAVFHLNSVIDNNYPLDKSATKENIQALEKNLEEFTNAIKEYEKLVNAYEQSIKPTTQDKTTEKPIAEISFIPDLNDTTNKTGVLQAVFTSGNPSTKDVSAVFNQIKEIPGIAEIFGFKMPEDAEEIADVFLRCLENNNQPFFEENDIENIKKHKDDLRRIIVQKVIFPEIEQYDTKKINVHFPDFDKNIDHYLNQALKIEAPKQRI